MISLLLVKVIVVSLVLSPLSIQRAYAHEVHNDIPEAQIEESHDCYPAFNCMDDFEMYTTPAALFTTPVALSFSDYVPFSNEYKALAAILAAGGIYFTDIEHMRSAVNLLYDSLDSNSRSLLNHRANNPVYVDNTSVRAIEWTAEDLTPIWNQAYNLFRFYVVNNGRMLHILSVSDADISSFHIGNYVGSSVIPVIDFDLLPFWETNCPYLRRHFNQTYHFGYLPVFSPAYISALSGMFSNSVIFEGNMYTNRMVYCHHGPGCRMEMHCYRNDIRTYFIDWDQHRLYWSWPPGAVRCYGHTLMPLGFVIGRFYSEWLSNYMWRFYSVYLQITPNHGAILLFANIVPTTDAAIGPRSDPIPNFLPAAVDVIIGNLAKANIVTSMADAQAVFLDTAGFVNATDYVMLRFPDSVHELLSATIEDVVISDIETITPSYAAYRALAAILAAGGIYFTTNEHMEAGVALLYNSLDAATRTFLNYNTTLIENVDNSVRATRWTTETLTPIWNQANSLFRDHVVDSGQMISRIRTPVVDVPTSFHIGNYIGESTIPVICLDFLPATYNLPTAEVMRTIGISAPSYVNALVSIPFPRTVVARGFAYYTEVFTGTPPQLLPWEQALVVFVDDGRSPIMDWVNTGSHTLAPVGFAVLMSDNQNNIELVHAHLRTNRYGRSELRFVPVVRRFSLRHYFEFEPTVPEPNVTIAHLASANVVTRMSAARTLFQETANVSTDTEHVLIWAPNRAYELLNATVTDVVIAVENEIIQRTGLVRYSSPIDSSRDYSVFFVFNEEYFFASSYEYNPSLATMSLLFQLSSWGSNDEIEYYNKMLNARNLLTEIGFVGFEHNYTDFINNGIIGKPTRDSIGVVAAHRIISTDDALTGDTREYTLIAMAVRGGNYESEWASNFTIGIRGYHQGFYQASAIVAQFLQDYINDQGITGDIKLWLTGYSRSGAAANLTAGGINSGRITLPPEVTLESHNFFTYTFATPAGVLRASAVQYENIFNILHPSDAVPMLAPYYWQFTRYGTDMRLPTRETAPPPIYVPSLYRMLLHFNALESVSANNARYQLNDFTMMRIQMLIGADGATFIQEDIHNHQTQHVFLHQYVSLITRDFLQTRYNYVAIYQAGLRDLAGLFFGASPYQTEIFLEDIISRLSSGWGVLVWDLFRPFGGIEAAQLRLAQYLRESLEVAGITVYSQQEFDNAVIVLKELLINVAVRHPNRATTLIYNIESIGQAHYPEIYLAWLMSMDPNYQPSGSVVFTSGHYRIIRINCPVDVMVYYNDELVASIIDDIPQNESSIVAAINEDGEKLVFLPATEEYNIILVATDDGEMSFSVSEFNPQIGGINRIVNYFDIPIVTGQRFNVLIPSFSTMDLEDRTTSASSTVYTLATGGTIILPDENLTGYQATTAIFDINVTSADNSQGIALGSGSRRRGSYAIVTAIPHNGYKFLGWYVDNITLVSADIEYRFRVMDNINLTARFIPMEEIIPSSRIRIDILTVQLPHDTEE